MINVNQTLEETIALSLMDRRKMELGSISPKETDAYKEIVKKLETTKQKLTKEGFKITSEKELSFDLKNLTWTLKVTAEKEMTDQEAKEYVKNSNNNDLDDLIKEIKQKIEPALEKVTKLFEENVEPVLEKAEKAFEEKVIPILQEFETVFEESGEMIRKFFAKKK